MKSPSRIFAAMLVLTQASWMVEPAQAQAGDYRGQRQHMPQHETRHQDMPSTHVQIQIGGYFQPQQREAAQAYYGRPENRGFCPPGLAKKGNGCLPPGQAKKWQQGHPLPPNVVYYDVPRSVVLTLGVPPPGYRYVRVASDILLIAVGTRIVIDAMEDLVR